eukprot:INCI9248.1.p1 GENE.INCI9248.1~~INCI9248.1.p1  ORF type:complete len:479 (+),score=44.96 INCI9248.1:259-1695(+)
MLSDIRLTALLCAVESICWLCLPCVQEQRIDSSLGAWVFDPALHGRLAAFLAALTLAALAVAVAFYHYNASVVFNAGSHVPAVWRDPRPFLRLLPFLRPVGILWRFATFPLRVLPDVYVVGETRCGTTSLCKQLRDQVPGVCGPFTPWDMELANEKESFYFVGHYWGLVQPACYRMAFPLRITQWFYRSVLGRPFIVYDGCASYLTAPWVAGLIHQATPNARIVVCLREPVAQNRSWWRLERKSMGFGTDVIGLPQPVSEAGFRVKYPPESLRAAWELSKSAEVDSLFIAAARFGAGFRRWRLPAWALPFPNGQLSAFAHMGRYAENIERYLHLFGRQRMLFVQTEDLTVDVPGVLRAVFALLGSVLLTEQVHSLKMHELQQHCQQPRSGLQSSVGRKCPVKDLTVVHMNAVVEDAKEAAPDSPAATPFGDKTMSQERQQLYTEMASYYAPHNKALEKLIGMSLGWNDLPLYALQQHH